MGHHDGSAKRTPAPAPGPRFPVTVTYQSEPVRTIPVTVAYDFGVISDASSQRVVSLSQRRDEMPEEDEMDNVMALFPEFLKVGLEDDDIDELNRVSQRLDAALASLPRGEQGRFRVLLMGVAGNLPDVELENLGGFARIHGIDLDEKGDD